MEDAEARWERGREGFVGNLREREGEGPGGRAPSLADVLTGINVLHHGQHHGHPIDDLQSAYMKEKDTPQKLLEQLTDTHWTDLTCLIEKLEEQKSHSEKIVQALCDVGNLINQEYTPQIERMKEIREQQLELVTLTTSLQEEAPLKFLEKVDDVRQRVQILKQRPLPKVQPVEIYPRVDYFNILTPVVF
ncbi:hypothetical protein MJT46_000321 [Ovis ammon polii x Ovis aries]|nr:hypothetical protein MJT46_000321 [Ovis ammon polii x Ovis aries]